MLQSSPRDLLRVFSERSARRSLRTILDRTRRGLLDNRSLRAKQKSGLVLTPIANPPTSIVTRGEEEQENLELPLEGL